MTSPRTILQQIQQLFKPKKDEPPPVKERRSLFTELIPIEFFDALSSLPCPINVTDALKRFRQIGRVEGRQEQLPVVYLEHCKEHCIPLREIAPGIFECYLCKLEAFSQSLSDGERHSDKISAQLPLGARQRNRSLQETQQVQIPPKTL